LFKRFQAIFIGIFPIVEISIRKRLVIEFDILKNFIWATAR